MTHGELALRACEAMKLSYAPYSGFNVGAALLCEDGQVFCGANIENAAYSATCCAERVALFSAISAGKRKFSAIAIAGGKNMTHSCQPCAPCGVCRQVMSEFCDPDFAVILAKADGAYEEYALKDLLPLTFNKNHLE